jgi:hypothetical protein
MGGWDQNDLRELAEKVWIGFYWLCIGTGAELL